MAVIIPEAEINELVKSVDLLEAMKEGFIQYSNGNAVVPPVGELLFDQPSGETHIKYGYIKEKDFYTIKIASGFPQNSELGISSSQGMMVLFSQKSGEAKAVLLDNGRLTDLRTAAAGTLVAKHFAPKKVSAIGVIGTGIQARLQLDLHLANIDCDSVWIWGRNQEKAYGLVEQYKNISIHVAETPSKLAEHSNVIVTTTSSTEPILRRGDIQAGTLVTAVGSDTPHKRELGAGVLAKADLVISDSLSQAKARGEVFQAVKDGSVSAKDVIELGSALQDKSLQRTNDEQIIVADLTGVAVQDIMIVEAVYMQYLNRSRP